MKTNLFALAVVAALAAPAAAQPLPGFGTMDRFDEQTKVATSLSYVGLDSDTFEDFTAIRFDFFGQYMTPQGYGGYAMMPFNYLSFMDESESGVGNLELGGLYVVQGNMPTVLRGGLALDTADQQTAGLGVFGRLTDFPTDVPEATWLRLSASPLFRSGTTFFRADAGVDIPIAESDEVDYDTFLRFNVGGGIETGDIALMGELVNVATTADDLDLDERLAHTVAVTGRYMGAGNLQPHMSVSFPLDDDIGDFVDFVVIVGLEYVISAPTTQQGPAAPGGPPPPPPMP